MEENLKQLTLEDLVSVLAAIAIRLGLRGLLTVREMVRIDKMVERIGCSLDEAA